MVKLFEKMRQEQPELVAEMLATKSPTSVP